MLKYYFILFTLLTLIVAGCSFSDPEPEEVQAQMDQEHARITEEQERQQEEEAEKLLAQEAAAAEESAAEEAAAKEAEAARLATVENETALDKIEKLLKPASIEVIQPEEPISEPGLINTISSGLKNLLGSSVKEQQENRKKLQTTFQLRKRRAKSSLCQNHLWLSFPHKNWFPAK